MRSLHKSHGYNIIITFFLGANFIERIFYQHNLIFDLRMGEKISSLQIKR